MRIFVTGATGFIGRALVRCLRARGWDVTALVRKVDGAEARELVALGATLASGDVTQRESMRAPMQGAAAVIHNAGLYEMGGDAALRARMTAVNIEGTRNTLGLAHELGVPKVVYVSTAFYWGDSAGRLRDETYVRQSVPGSPYEETKTEAHELALGFQRNGCPLVIACPVSVVGAGDHSALGRFARMYVRGVLPPVLFGDGTPAFVHVDDVAAANVAALESPHAVDGPLNVASGSPRTVLDLAAALSDAFGADAPRPEVVGGARPGDVRHVFASVDRLASALGFRARVAFDDGVADFARAPLRGRAGGR